MEIIEANSELRKAVKKARRKGQSIGFVPTMGYLHEGHLSLMRQARQDNDVVVVSIFVNPTQFGPNEDLDAYPRDFARDKALMAAENVDLAYFPSIEQLYPEGYTTYVNVEGPMSQVLCGRSRPVHFRGVTTIVTKLFHLVSPDRAYFGQKDAQQVAIIQQMVKDLDFDLEVVVCPIVREADGLAMSSRNTYLSPQHRADAVVLSQSLFKARDMISKGERQAEAILRHIEANIRAVPDAVIDYIAIVDAQTLSDVSWLDGEILIAIAVKLSGTRLIDNIRIRV
ncbi:MAG: pantoate--beta-alanine ligase [Desulfobacteraceae bacterium]|jgi:pantoate--beta-alanine ligase